MRTRARQLNTPHGIARFSFTDCFSSSLVWRKFLSVFVRSPLFDSTCVTPRNSSASSETAPIASPRLAETSDSPCS